MIRNLLATTAIATIVATGAYAQTTTPTTTQDPAATTTTQAPAAPQQVEMVKRADGFLANNLIGQSVYNGIGDDAENIGSINDLVISPEGDVQAVVIGVGVRLAVDLLGLALEPVAGFINRLLRRGLHVIPGLRGGGVHIVQLAVDPLDLLVNIVLEGLPFAALLGGELRVLQALLGLGLLHGEVLAQLTELGAGFLLAFAEVVHGSIDFRFELVGFTGVFLPARGEQER